MRRQDEFDHSTLSWVKKELDETLKQAGQALEAYTEDTSDTTQLRFCATYMHQVQGILQMLELYGAGMLAEEMEHVTRAILDGKVSRPEEGYEVLMRAILSLSDYLDKIQGGHKDIPLLVLPLLNDLRALRGENLLTENAMFTPDISISDDTPKLVSEHAEQVDVQRLTKQKRHQYQLGLLALLRNNNPKQGVSRMTGVMEEMLDHVSNEHVASLFWIAKALLEAIEDDGIDASTAVKMLLGQIDRQMRQIGELGEQSYADAVPSDLVRNLLYYVGRSEPTSDTVKAVQERYQLSAFLPNQRELERAKKGMAGPTSDMLATVSNAIKEDLATVKDGLDVYVRGGAKSPEKLEDLVSTLNRVGDTLGMLGLGDPRRVIKEQAQAVSALREGLSTPDEKIFMEVASALLYVESAVESLLGHKPTEEMEQESGEVDSQQILLNHELDQIFDITIREAIANLVTIKEAIMAYLDNKDFETISQVPETFGQVRGAMSVLGLNRAASIVASAAEYIDREVVSPQKHPENDQLETYAEAISSVEYYLEAELERRGHRGAILDMAENCLSALGYAPDTETLLADSDLGASAEEAKEASTVEQPSEEASLEVSLDVDADLSEEVVAESEEIAVEPKPDVAPAPAPKAKFSQSALPKFDAPVLSDDSDEEILEIFLEEAEELLETLNEQFPKWRNQPDDNEALSVVRRMFHTFKGSGRLAGALQVGELSWAIENLLNRVIEGAIPADSNVFAAVGDVIDLLPEMVEQAKGGNAPSENSIALMVRAYQIIEPGFEYSEDDGAQVSDVVEVAEVEPEEVVSAEVQEVQEEQAPDEAVAPSSIEFSFDADEFVEHDDVVEPVEVHAEPEGVEVEALNTEESHEPVVDDVSTDEGITVDFSMDEESEDEPMDPVLYEIFSKETRDHLEAVTKFVETAKSSGEPAVVNLDLVRALHTLGGSARMAGVENIANLGKALENFIEAVLAIQAPLNDEHVVALDEGCNAIEGMLAALGDSSLEAPNASELIEFIDALRHQLPEFEGDSAIPTIEQLAAQSVVDDVVEVPTTGTEAIEPEPEVHVEVEPVVQRSAPEPQNLSELDEVDQDLVDIFLEEADDILSFLESSIHRWEENPEDENVVKELHRSLHTLKGGARMAGFSGVAAISHVLESLANDVEDGKIAGDDDFYGVMHQSLDELMHLNEQAKKGLVAQPRQDLMDAITTLRGGKPSDESPDEGEGSAYSYDAPEADAELVEVFLEEAVEILASTEKSLLNWIEQPDNEDLIVELQRALHTLKGGARMAGFKPIADLSHHVESILTDIVDKKLDARAELFDLLEVVNDALIVMRDRAEQGQTLQADTELENRLIAFREGKVIEALPELAPKATASVDTQEVPEPVEAKSPKMDLPPEGGEAKMAQTEASGGSDVIRVKADLLDNLVNYAGEVSIYRARLDQQVGSMRFNLDELDQTVLRLRDQLRTMEIETEAQILFRYEKEQDENEIEEDTEEFDPLELDRFSRMQELSRALSESVNDLSSIQGMLDHLSRETETLLLQQSRVNTELTEGLMRTRMVPFSNLVPRMRRIVRQTCSELGKKAQLKVMGAEGEMDRTVLERVIAPLEHMLRNALAHGIEAPAKRQGANKPESGTIKIEVSREGADVVLEVSDDGQGINLEAIRKKAREKGWLQDEMMLSDNEVMQFILESGFSTAEAVTQIAGRGVGMDVVNAEIKQLGGNLHIDSQTGSGTKFTIRLPFTLAINRALLVMASEEVYAIPLSSIEGIVRMAHEELQLCYEDGGEPYYDYAGQRYQLRNLGNVLGLGEPVLPGKGKRSPVVLVQAGDHRIAMQVDQLMGNREIVMKSVGSQLSTVPGISGATILADGRVVLILEVSALTRTGAALQSDADAASGAGDSAVAVPSKVRRKPLIMVVDDSITMRKVSTRLLERNAMDVITAKDGVDAVSVLQENIPDAMLLDIEMPRMDGYELATHMKKDDRLKNIPIIMITSRTGEKHKQRAMDIGVDRYLGKPYQESDLLENLGELLGERREPA